MQKDDFILVIDQKLQGDNYFNSIEPKNITYGRLGLLVKDPGSKFHYYIENFKFGPNEPWALLDFEKIDLLQENRHYIIPIEKPILINLSSDRVSYTATEENKEFFNGKIILEEDCNLILKLMKEKEKTFTEGVEDGQIKTSTEQDVFNPLKQC
jgi:hypothetical protein